MAGENMNAGLVGTSGAGFEWGGDWTGQNPGVACISTLLWVLELPREQHDEFVGTSPAEAATRWGGLAQR